MVPAVYFPIEIQHRELPSRLLIAAHLLARGHPVVIGSHWSLVTEANQAALPPALYLFKSVNRIQGNAMQSVTAHGHIAAANDEEALNAIGDSGYAVAFSENAADACALFFAQSETHRDAIARRFPQLTGKIRVTGNPRVDLLLPTNRGMFDASDTRVKENQPYILFNTNYGTINSVWNDRQGVVAVAEAAGQFDGDRAAKVAEFEAIVAWEKANFHAMTALLTWTIENVRGVNIVVRPHPAERVRYWEKILAKLPAARLIDRSDPHPWITGAQLVVHTGCTTGLEAMLLGRPALNLLPHDHPTCDRLVTAVNPTFRTWEDAARAMAEFLQSHRGPIASHGASAAAALDTYLPSYRDNSAALLMAEALMEELARRGAHAGAQDTFVLRQPFVEKPINDLMRHKYHVGEGDIRSGLAVAARLAGVAFDASLETLATGTFLLQPA